ncbi:MAG: hypothetical protein JXQ76_10900 [Campylobacterales bacterium]|nr:hypothetical protein [Campylobacterales bacterium]
MEFILTSLLKIIAVSLLGSLIVLLFLIRKNSDKELRYMARDIAVFMFFIVIFVS